MRYHGAAYTDTGLELRLDDKITTLKHETIGARSLGAREQTSSKISVNWKLIRWINCYLSTGDKCGPTARATTEGPGGPHRGHAGKLINSTVNGSASDLPVQTRSAGLEGKQGVSSSSDPGQ